MPFFERERDFARKRAKGALCLIREKNGVQTFQSRQVIPCGIMERNGRKKECPLGGKSEIDAEGGYRRFGKNKGHGRVRLPRGGGRLRPN